MNAEALGSRKWKPFFIEDLFEILPGKRLTKSDMIPGPIPFIGASESNNGITNWVSNDNASRDSNVLGINYNGSVCVGFYHPYECLFSDDVKRIRIRDKEGSSSIFLFLKTVIEMQRVKYGYGYKFNEGRMQRQILLLPVGDDGEPDYAFMERYMSAKRGGALMHTSPTSLTSSTRECS